MLQEMQPENRQESVSACSWVHWIDTWGKNTTKEYQPRLNHRCTTSKGSCCPSSNLDEALSKMRMSLCYVLLHPRRWHLLEGPLGCSTSR